MFKNYGFNSVAISSRNNIKDHDIQAQLISFDIKSALRLAKK